MVRRVEMFPWRWQAVVFGHVSQRVTVVAAAATVACAVVGVGVLTGGFVGAHVVAVVVLAYDLVDVVGLVRVVIVFGVQVVEIGVVVELDGIGDGNIYLQIEYSTLANMVKTNLQWICDRETGKSHPEKNETAKFDN